VDTADAYREYRQRLEQRERQGLERGFQQGRRATLTMVLRLLEHRFGPDPHIERALSSLASLGDLLAAHECLLEADTLDEARASIDEIVDDSRVRSMPSLLGVGPDVSFRASCGSSSRRCSTVAAPTTTKSSRASIDIIASDSSLCTSSSIFHTTLDVPPPRLSASVESVIE
jgi:hypothetical protein